MKLCLIKNGFCNQCGISEDNAKRKCYHDNDFGELNNSDINVIKPFRSRREIIFEKDNYTCLACGNKNDLTIDHIIPKSMGGSNEEDNLQTLCRGCNLLKGSKIRYYRNLVV